MNPTKNALFMMTYAGYPSFNGGIQVVIKRYCPEMEPVLRDVIIIDTKSKQCRRLNGLVVFPGETLKMAIMNSLLECEIAVFWPSFDSEPNREECVERFISQHEAA